MSLAIAFKVFPLRLYLEMLIPAIEFPRAMYLVSKTKLCCLEPSKSVWSVFITTGLCPFTLPWDKGTFPPVESLSASRNFSTLTLNSHVGDTFHMSLWRLKLNSTNLITDLPIYMPMLNSYITNQDVVPILFTQPISISLHIHDWVGTQYISQASLKFRDKPVSASQVLC